jgi:hypothetical protein
VVGYGPFSLCVIHKEGLCPSRGDINRLVMVVTIVLLGLYGVYEVHEVVSAEVRSVEAQKGDESSHVFSRF